MQNAELFSHKNMRYEQQHVFGNIAKVRPNNSF